LLMPFGAIQGAAPFRNGTALESQRLDALRTELQYPIRGRFGGSRIAGVELGLGKRRFHQFVPWIARLNRADLLRQRSGGVLLLAIEFQVRAQQNHRAAAGRKRRNLDGTWLGVVGADLYAHEATLVLVQSE